MSAPSVYRWETVHSINKLINSGEWIRRQAGLSLIEVLISLFLSSLMIVALFTFFANVKANTSAQNSVLETQHTVRIATDLIRSEVQKAGFKNDLSANQTPFANASGPFDASRYVRGEVTPAGQQRLHVRYQSDGAIQDCVGNQVPVDRVVQISLFLAAGQLVCESTIEGTPGTNQFAMLDGISTLSFSYLNESNDTYENTARANGVRAVKFQITFTEQIASESAVQQTISRGYTQVVALRNIF